MEKSAVCQKKAWALVFLTVMDGLYLKITEDFTPDAKEARFGGKDAPMAVEKGDIIFDVRKRGDGWMYGKNLNSGKTGRFPESCAAKLSSNKKTSSSSNSVTDNKDGKPTVKNEASKPSWLQNRTISSAPSTRKTPNYPKPYGGNNMETPEIAEGKKETSGDSGVVEDSNGDGYCNADDEPKAVNRDASKTGNAVKNDKQKEVKVFPRSLASSRQTFDKHIPERSVNQEKEPEKQKKSGVVFTESRAAPKLTRTFQRSTPVSKKASEEDLDDKYEPVEKKNVDKGPLMAKAKPKSAMTKEEPKISDTKATTIKSITESKVAKEGRTQSDVTKDSNAAGGVGVNIQDNPLTAKETSIYQVPGSLGPPKPARNFSVGCTECNEAHIYDTPMHFKTPTGTPSAEKEDSDTMTAEKPKDAKRKGGSTSLKPTSSVIRKTKEQMKHRMASYEDIEMEGRRSDEGDFKDADLVAKQPKGKLLTPNRRPKLRIFLGTLSGLLLGVFIFLTLFLLTGQHVITCTVSAFLIALVVGTIFGFLDKTRLQCIVLLIFPSLFALGGKICLWLLITFFLVSGPLCNFIGNVRVVALSRSCLMAADSSAENSSVNPAVFTANEDNRAILQRVQKFENISHALQTYINNSLRLTSFNRNGNLTSGVTSTTSEVICMRHLDSAYNICSAEVEKMYTKCAQTSDKIPGICEVISAKNICLPISEYHITNACRSIAEEKVNMLLQIKEIIDKSPHPLQMNEIQREGETAHIAPGELCEFTAIIVMLLPLLALLVLYEAYNYHKRYLSCNEFDNHYLTVRFKAIEDMRKSSGVADLLVPLKKGELQQFVQPTACHLAKAEKTSLLKCLLAYIIYTLFALSIVLLDYFFHIVVTNEEPQSNISNRCQGALQSPREQHTVILSALLGVLLLIILLQSFLLRLRRLISSRFYPRRERKRIAYLYYKLLEERKTFYKSVIEKMNNFAEETEILNRLDAVLVLCNHFSWIKKVLEFVGVCIRRCAVCGTGLSRNYLLCDTEDCDVIYCRTCFWDLENKCLGCMRSSKMTSVSSSLSNQSQRKKNEYIKSV